MSERIRVERPVVCLLRWMLLLAASLTGCNSANDMPPPNKPQPEKQSTAEGLEMAEKLLVAVQAKDVAQVGALRDEINKELQSALQAGDGEREHDYGRLNAVVYLTDQGEWAKAEETLRELIQNSKVGGDS